MTTKELLNISRASEEIWVGSMRPKIRTDA